MSTILTLARPIKKIVDVSLTFVYFYTKKRNLEDAVT